MDAVVEQAAFEAWLGSLGRNFVRRTASNWFGSADTMPTYSASWTESQWLGWKARANIERCKCGYPMPCAVSVPVTFCRALVLDCRRWKSTHAPRLDALQGLLATAQMEAHAGREAVATVASERAANALLTNEVERLRALLNECEPAVYSQHMAQIGTRLAMPETLLYRVRGA